MNRVSAARLLTAALVASFGATTCARPATSRSALPFYRTAALEPEWLDARTADAPSMHRVASFSLLDQNGQGITEATLHGRITVVQFFFTKCGDICPTTTRNLARVLDRERDSRFQIVSYSVTPDRDGPAELRAFAAARGIADSRWHLLTGDRSAVDRLARESYFVRLGDGATYGVSSIQHTETVLLIDGERRLRGVYAGSLPLEMEKLAEDAGRLLSEQRVD